MRQDGSNDRRQGQTWEQLVAAEPGLASLLEEVRAARPRSASEPIMPPCIGDSFVRSLELREMTCPLPAWLDRERPRPLASVVRVRDGVSTTGGALGSQSTGDTLFTGGYRLYRIVPDSASTAEGSTRHKVTGAKAGDRRKCLAFSVKTERGGFEPPRPVSQSNGLANRRYRPLSHLSLIAARRPDRGAKFAAREVTKSATASSTARRAVRRRTRDASCKWPDLQL